MKKKILILTASPQRDLEIDNLLADELRSLGSEVWVKPCLREGRDAALEIKPDIVVMPPIRNVYSRDFANQCTEFGCAVVTRHTEPSIAWEDYKAISGKERVTILGQFAYNVVAEIVWSEDEVQMLKQRNVPFPIISVGAFYADIYKQDGFNEKFMSRERFNDKHKLDNNKKTILLSSAWGFIDSSPDLQIDGQRDVAKDDSGRSIWIDMAKRVHKELSGKYNILITLHPNVDISIYKKELEPLGLEIDTESPAVELLKNCDCLVHAGSTMSVEMYLLNKPAFQFGDVNNLVGANWWQRSDAAISRVSPHCDSAEKLVESLDNFPAESNANLDTIKELEEGRYGNMDGKATKRTAEIINKFTGKFEYCWPCSPYDYTQLTVRKSLDGVANSTNCGICKKSFVVISSQWLKELLDTLPLTEEQAKVNLDTLCPHCGARFFRKEDQAQ